jgi:uncharacterized membrane protein
MADLVAIGFKGDRSRASEVLDRLRELDFRWVIDLESAIAMFRDLDGTLHVRQDPELTTGVGVGLGSLIGSLTGAILAVPFIGGASAAAAAAALATGALSGTAAGATFGAVEAKWWKDDFGGDGLFIKDIAAMIQPGDSAIFAMLSAEDPDAVAQQFEEYGGTVLRSSLTPAQITALEEYLGKHSKATEP